VTDFLYRYKIPAEFNPAGDCQRAPITSTTGEAIEASTGSIEQEVMESIAQGLPGFNGGWISSIYLDRLLDRLGLVRKISHSRRKEMLEGLGYRPHPAFKDGRVNNVVLPDGGKPRLYIASDALARQITSPTEAAKNYEAFNNHQAAPTYHRSLPFGRSNG
jgi:hypothetical protein